MRGLLTLLSASTISAAILREMQLNATQVNITAQVNISALHPVKVGDLFASAEQKKREQSSQQLRGKSIDELVMSPCGLFGGLISPQLTSSCCSNVQVVAQRALENYGLAKSCHESWHCEVDGTTPKQDFEEAARTKMCGEERCVQLVTEAMTGNWMTQKGSRFFDKACDAGAGTVEEQVRLLASELESGTDLESEGEVEDSSELGARRRRRNKKGKKAKATKKKKKSSGCFPGHAVVEVLDVGSKAMSATRIGDMVLTEDSKGQYSFEPLLAFLHKTHGPSEFLTVEHERGQFRATENHLVFVHAEGRRQDRAVGSLEAGEFLIANKTPSRITAVTRSEGAGMFAPLTASGTIVVDGVLASNYATPSMDAHLPHAWAHAVMKPLRMYHQSGVRAAFCRWWDCESLGQAEEMHPYVSALLALNMESLLQAMSPAK